MLLPTQRTHAFKKSAVNKKLIQSKWNISDLSLNESFILVMSSYTVTIYSYYTVAIYLGASLPPLLRKEVFSSEQSLNNNSGNKNETLVCGGALFKC